MMTMRVQCDKGLWELYSQTVVRFVYYASEVYSGPHELASFAKDGGHKLVLSN